MIIDITILKLFLILKLLVNSICLKKLITHIDAEIFLELLHLSEINTKFLDSYLDK